VPLVSRSALVIAITAAALLAGCPGEHFPSCQSEAVSHPEGKCSAYYYQTDYGSSGKTTQALVQCNTSATKPGGNVVAFHSLQHGIGLTWLDPHTLQVAVPEDVKLEDQRASDTYDGYLLRYVYRLMLEGEPAFGGCGLGTAQSGT
jgi:hypothetical protein